MKTRRRPLLITLDKQNRTSDEPRAGEDVGRSPILLG